MAQSIINHIQVSENSNFNTPIIDSTHVGADGIVPITISNLIQPDVIPSIYGKTLYMRTKQSSEIVDQIEAAEDLQWLHDNQNELRPFDPWAVDEYGHMEPSQEGEEGDPVSSDPGVDEGDPASSDPGVDEGDPEQE